MERNRLADELLALAPTGRRIIALAVGQRAPRDLIKNGQASSRSRPGSDSTGRPQLVPKIHTDRRLTV